MAKVNWIEALCASRAGAPVKHENRLLPTTRALLLALADMSDQNRDRAAFYVSATKSAAYTTERIADCAKTTAKGRLVIPINWLPPHAGELVEVWANVESQRLNVKFHKPGEGDPNKLTVVENRGEQRKYTVRVYCRRQWLLLGWDGTGPRVLERVDPEPGADFTFAIGSAMLTK